MTAAQVDPVPQVWDAALLAAELRLRFLAAHARLTQAQLILTHRDRMFPKTLDECLDDAEREIADALDELDGGPEWRRVVLMQRTPTAYDPDDESRNYIPSAPLTVVPTLPRTHIPLWPKGFEKPERRKTVALLALGFTVSTIGAHLHRSPDAIKSRLQQAYNDLEVANQPQLVDHAWRVGLMRIPEIIEYQALHRPPLRPVEITELPPRRQQILVLLAAGYSYAEMADELGLSALTVKAHLALTFRSMGMKGVSSAGVVHRAWELGWLPAVTRT